MGSDADPEGGAMGPRGGNRGLRKHMIPCLVGHAKDHSL
jgi:hypothetical protein